MVLWSPEAAEAFLWRPPGCPYSGRQAEALGRAPGFGGGGGPRGWIIEKSGRICSPTPFRLNCNPVWCTWFLGRIYRFPGYYWPLDEQMITNGGGVSGVLVQHIAGYYWCSSTRPRHHYGADKPQVQLLGKCFFAGTKSFLIWENDPNNWSGRASRLNWRPPKLRTYMCDYPQKKLAKNRPI